MANTPDGTVDIDVRLAGVLADVNKLYQLLTGIKREATDARKALSQLSVTNALGMTKGQRMRGNQGQFLSDQQTGQVALTEIKRELGNLNTLRRLVAEQQREMDKALREQTKMFRMLGDQAKRVLASNGLDQRQITGGATAINRRESIRARAERDQASEITGGATAINRREAIRNRALAAAEKELRNQEKLNRAQEKAAADAERAARQSRTGTVREAGSLGRIMLNSQPDDMGAAKSGIAALNYRERLKKQADAAEQRMVEEQFRDSKEIMAMRKSVARQQEKRAKDEARAADRAAKLQEAADREAFQDSARVLSLRRALAKDEERRLAREASERKRTEAATPEARKGRIISGIEANSDPDVIRARTRQNNAQALDRISADGGAGLFQIQAKLMANYALMSAVLQTISFMGRFIVEFDQSMGQLAAISDSSRGSMEKLKATIIDVSKQTKFSAVEIADAATVLAQAGFSVAQINNSIKGVALLATATGSDLKAAVDIITSAIGVFNLQAEETGTIANTLTAALNLSKLTMDKLVLGFQYASNVAADAGVNFQEFTAVLAAFSNAGIKSGSTLGTGLRQLIIDLLTPTDKFKENLNRVGLSLEDVNVRTQGLVGVLRNLQKAGFSSADAMGSFEVRAANAFVALSGQLDTIESLRRSFLLNDAAAAANAKQMETLANKAANLRNIIGALAETAAGPLVSALKGLADISASAFKGLSASTGLLQTSLTVVVSLLGGAILTSIGRLTVGLLAYAGGTNLAAAGTSRLALALTLLARNPILWVAAGIGTLITLFGVFGSKSKDLDSNFDQLKTRLEEVAGASDRTKNTLSAINKTIDELISHSARLNQNEEELRTVLLETRLKFEDQGLAIGKNIKSAEDLIKALQGLRTELAKKYVMELDVEEKATRASASVQFLRAQRAMEAFGESSKNVPKSLLPGTGALNDPRAPKGKSFLGTAMQAIGGASALSGANPEDQANNLATFIGVLEEELNKLTTLRGNPEALKAQAPSGVSPELVKKQIDQDINYIVQNINTLKSVREALRGGMQLVEKADAVARQGEKAAFIASPGGQDIREIIERARGAYNARRDQLKTGAQGGDPTGLLKQGQGFFKPSDIARREQVQLLAREEGSQILNEAYELLQNWQKSDPDRYKKAIESPLLQELNTISQQFLLETSDFMKEGTVARKQIWEDRKKVLEERLQILIRKAKTQSRLELEGTEREGLGIIGEVNNLDMLLKKSDLYSRKGGVAPDVAAQEIQNLADKGKEDIKDFRLQINDLLAGTYNLADDIDTIVQDMKTGIKKINDRVRDILRTTDLGVKGAKATAEADDLPVNRHLSDVQRRLNKKRVEDAETERAGNRTRQLPGQIDAYATKIEELSTKLKALKKVEEEQRQLADSPFAEGGAETNKEAQARHNRTKTDISKLTEELRAAQSGLEAAKDEFDKASTEYIERTVAQPSESLMDLLKEATEQWRESVGIFKTLNAEIADGWYQSLGDMSSALSQFMQDVASRTATIKDAFKNLATSIVQSMLKIVTDKAAAKLISLLADIALSILPNLFMPSTMTGGLGTKAPNTGSKFIMGGFVRAAAGRSAPARDSVPALLMPGEYVMRKSAVDAIGRDQLDMMNAAGNRTVAQSPDLTSYGKPKSDSQPVNVWVVSPDQVPPPGPKDIIATVGRDIATGGPLKKLIQQVNAGI